MSSSIATPNKDSTNFCYTGTIPSDRPSGLIQGKNCKVNTLHNRAGVRQKRLGGLQRRNFAKLYLAYLQERFIISEAQ